MKTLLNCDDVFETLTAGPFPTGQPLDDRIRQHLAECIGCSNLADALRPACNLLHEALGPAERESLPMFADGEDRHVRGIMREIARQSPIPANPASWSIPRMAIWNVLAASVLMMLAIPWFAERFVPGASSTHRALAVNQTLLALNLPHECIWLRGEHGEPHPGIAADVSCLECHASMAKTPSSLQHACCTSCHRSTPDRRRAPVGGMAVLIAACQECHQR